MSVSTAIPSPPRRATLDDLLKVEGKAELIGGRIVHYMATGTFQTGLRFGSSAASTTTPRLRVGELSHDSMGFAVPELPSGRVLLP